MSLELFFQNLINGLTLGSLYALIAVGYTMVYGILRLINFAHGEVFMFSTYFAFFGIMIFTLPWYISFIIAIILTSMLGVTIEKVAYRPLRKTPKVYVLISAIGVSFFLQNLGLVLFGGRPRAFPRPEFIRTTMTIAGIRVSAVFIVILIIVIPILIGLLFFLYKTKLGLAMRAASWNYDVSRLMGIDIDRVISLTFIIGSALAAVGGIMWAQRFPEINPIMGLFPGMKAFICAVFGGIGNIGGAMLGGICLGLAEIMLVAFLPGLSGYRDAFAFIMLITILLVKPTGLLGEKTVVKA